MRKISIYSIGTCVLVLMFSTVAWVQNRGQQRAERTTAASPVPSVPPPPGWKTCPRCQNATDRTQAWARNNIDSHQFNPKDLSGVWGYDGVGGVGGRGTFTKVPPLTAWGKQKQQETIGGRTPDGSPVYSKETSLLNCDPLGYPRLFQYNYGMEFVMLPDRVLQFFEWGHTWRTIWTDGRKLPADPPEPRWLGWNVGHWEGNEFVIESSGFDDRSWIMRAPPNGGWPHSDEMRIVERYKRTGYGTLEAKMTITDPKAYTEPWDTPWHVIKMVPDTELWEYNCVPSDSAEFNSRVYLPAAGVAK
jgi:hypothetical protein